MSHEAYQYVVEEHGGELVLSRKHPEMPLQPDKAMELSRFKSQIKTTEDRRIILSDAIIEKMGVEVGGETNLGEFANAFSSVLGEHISQALQPLVGAMSRVAESFADNFSGIDLEKADD